MSKVLTGTVVSTKMDKTVVVMIERKFRHPAYRKVIKRHSNYKAHYEGSSLKEGDTVTIRECRPISKTKNFIVVETAEMEAMEAKKTAEKKAAKAEVVETAAKAKAPKAKKTVKKTAAKKTTKKSKLTNSKK